MIENKLVSVLIESRANQQASNGFEADQVDLNFLFEKDVFKNDYNFVSLNLYLHLHVLMKDLYKCHLSINME